MATGDLEGNLERLRVQLRTIGYSHPLDMNGLREGNPASVLPLLHYALLGYSRHVSRYLSENGYALFAKSDLRFVECTLKYLRGEHAYRCPLTVAQTIKRNTMLHDIVKNIDAANLDSLHLDETLSMALEKVSQAQGHANDIFTSELKLESTFEKKKDFELGKRAQITNPQSKVQQSIHEKKETIVREIEMGSKIAAQPKISESCGSASNNNAVMESTCDVDASLSQCYEKLRTQIIEVAEKMERLLLTLKGDVQRITSDMQVKLTCLERQALYLGQAIPSRDLIGQKTTSSYNSLQLCDYMDYIACFKPFILTSNQRSFPLKAIDGSIMQRSFNHTLTDIDFPQTQFAKSMGGLYNHHEQLSTEKLIATVKARCNKTKELLSDTEWIGPT